MAKDEHNRDVNEKLPGEKPEGTHHFNPGNPNTSLAINCNAANGQCTAPTGIRDYTSTTFGTITTAQVQARHMALTVRIAF